MEATRKSRWPLPLLVGGWIFLVMTLLGLLVGTLNLLNPQAVHIPFGPNGESAEGLDGVLASVASSAVLGLALALPAALIFKLVAGGKVAAPKKTIMAGDEASMQDKRRTEL